MEPMTLKSLTITKPRKPEPKQRTAFAAKTGEALPAAKGRSVDMHFMARIQIAKPAEPAKAATAKAARPAAKARAPTPAPKARAALQQMRVAPPSRATISRTALDAGAVDLGPHDGLLPPMHPGEVLRAEFLEPLGLSAHALALALRVPANRIGAILAGTRAISADTALRLARHFGTSAGFWQPPESL